MQVYLRLLLPRTWLNRH